MWFLLKKIITFRYKNLFGNLLSFYFDSFCWVHLFSDFTSAKFILICFYTIIRFNIHIVFCIWLFNGKVCYFLAFKVLHFNFVLFHLYLSPSVEILTWKQRHFLFLKRKKTLQDGQPKLDPQNWFGFATKADPTDKINEAIPSQKAAQKEK